MTRIKLCGLSRSCDIEAANELRPEYIGFVFAKNSRRYVNPEKARELKGMLMPGILAVGVFVDEAPETVAELLNDDVIDIAQLHGKEDVSYIHRLRQLTDKPLIKAFRINSDTSVTSIEECPADHILLDSGAGSGTVLDWQELRNIQRPYFLAGGLTPENVADALRILHPCAVDVSSGIETGGVKDKKKMAAFVAAVRKEDSI